MGVHHVCAWCRGRSQEWVLHPLELELQAFVSPVGAGNGTCVLLQEQQGLLTTEHLITPSLCGLLLYMCLCVLSCWRREKREEGREEEEQMRKEKISEGGVAAVLGGPQEVWQARPL